MSLLVISSSLNSESYSRTLANEAVRVLKEDGVAHTYLDLRKLPLPFCDGDKAYGHPDVARARELIAAASGVLIATPIYNYDANAVVKNLIELTGQAWENKVVGFLCSAGGSGSLMSIMGLANSLMLDFRCVIVPRFVHTTAECFRGEAISDPKIVARVAGCARATVKLAAAVKGG
ncbi:MAG: NADPH-dependent FMN reductase [Opitutus sp.]